MTKVHVVTCLKDWREGRAVYFQAGDKYRIDRKEEKGLFLNSEQGLKWVSEYQFHKHFLSSKNKGKLEDKEEDPFTTAREIKEYLTPEERKVVISNYTKMAIGYAEDHVKYEKAKENNPHLAKAQEWSVFFAELAEIYQDEE